MGERVKAITRDRIVPFSLGVLLTIIGGVFWASTERAFALARLDEHEKRIVRIEGALEAIGRMERAIIDLTAELKRHDGN